MKLFCIYDSYFRPFYLLIETQSNQTTILKGTVVQATANTYKPQKSQIPYVPLVLTPILFISLWVVAKAIFTSNVRKSSHNDKVNSSSSQEVPCKNCQFFKDNHYLNCAVHPSVVLTKQALNCPDYSPKSSTNESESTDDYFR